MQQHSPRRGRRPKAEAGGEPPAHIVWRNGRAYADFRNWARWGARANSQEPLVDEGEVFATSDRGTAAILFGARLAELRALRAQHPKGIPQETEDPLDCIIPYVGYHIARLTAKRATLTSTEIGVRRVRLTHAAAFFTQERKRKLLRQITLEDIQAWLDELQANPPAPTRERKGGRRGKLKGYTRRRYLRTLRAMLHRAWNEGRIPENPVDKLLKEDLPEHVAEATPFLEINQAALLLEAARRYQPSSREAHPENFPKLATYLLTGGRGKEVEELEIADVDLRHGMVHFRPNATRRALADPRREVLLKNHVSERWVPLWPQLREILEEYLNGPNAPEGPRLFSGGSFRSWLASVSAVAGFPKGFVNRRVLRVTYCTTRVQTLDHGAPVAARTVAHEMGHTDLTMMEQVYARVGKNRQRREFVEYRWDEWAAELEAQLKAPPLLTEGQLRTLAVLAGAPDGLASKAWMLASGDNPGTFVPRQKRMVALGLVVRDGGEKRGSRFRVTAAGAELLAAHPALLPGERPGE